MDKKEAIRIITECAKKYEKQLSNQNLLFLFGEAKNPKFIEAAFLPFNFMHLTGANISSIKSNRFYNLCLNQKLKEIHISIYKDGTTEKKLSVLPQLMDISSTAKMIGDFNNTGFLLQSEKIVGNTVAIMGFVKVNGYYIPNTALKEDCRNLSSESPKRILAILKKPMAEKQYQTITYLAKKLDFHNIKIPPELENKIDVLFPFVQKQSIKL